MLTKEDIEYLQEHAYVPEHLPNLMTSISGGEPHLVDGHLLLVGESWVIINGYPIEGTYSEKRFLSIYESAEKRFKPSVILAISPSLPEKVSKEAHFCEKDFYYILNLTEFLVPRGLGRSIEETRRSVRVVFETSYTELHGRLVEEFIEKKKPNDVVLGLYLSLPRLLRFSPWASLISAYTEDGRLMGFYAIDVESKKFLTYVLGCRDLSVTDLKISDLIFLEMVEYAKAKGKEYVHLGLGVNEGIRRFKEKWGGKPSIPYEFVEIKREGSLLKSISSLERIL